MDSRQQYDYAEEGSGSETSTIPPAPSPPVLSTGYVTYEQARGCNQSMPKSASPHNGRQEKISRNDSPHERRKNSRRSKSPLARTNKRSRSTEWDKEQRGDCDKDRDDGYRERYDRDKVRDYDRPREREHDRNKDREDKDTEGDRDRDRDRSKRHRRDRSRSRERRRSSERSRNRDRRRRDSRRRRRAPSNDSDAASEDNLSQSSAPPLPNAFKNDGSFMEMFKKMQEQMVPAQQQPTVSVLEEKPVAPPPLMVGKRRGGRILKTGMVAKAKAEPVADQPKDAWSLYMAEVKKYREVCCQEEDNTRPLVK